MGVSILSPSEEGLQQLDASYALDVSGFQSSAPPKRGCNASSAAPRSCTVLFQSSAPPKRGCNHNRRRQPRRCSSFNPQPSEEGLQPGATRDHPKAGVRFILSPSEEGRNTIVARNDGESSRFHPAPPKRGRNLGGRAAGPSTRWFQSSALRRGLQPGGRHHGGHPPSC